jgi:hypothetical protein
MPTRVIVGLHPGAGLTPELRTTLSAVSAGQMSEPDPAMPDVVVLTLPDSVDADAAIADLKTRPGVRYAERDAMRFSS